jgi:hypothetical protein
MRDYKVDSIEAKFRADLEQLGQYCVIIPLEREDISAYIQGFEKLEDKKANEICREIITMLEFELMMMNSVPENPKASKFLGILQNVIKRICRIHKLKYVETDTVFILGEGSA